MTPGTPSKIGMMLTPSILSLISFSPTISEKLVNYWVEQLKKSPELHDKIEFEVAITTYSFDIDEKIEQLIGDTLNTTEKEEFNKHTSSRQFS